MLTRGLALGACLVGCASSLPPLAVEHIAPRVVFRAPPANQGQVVVDAVDAPDARLDEITGRGKIVTGFVWNPIQTFTITKGRCDSLPCVIDAPYGKIELAVSADSEQQTFRIAVDEKRSYVRVRLPQHERPGLAFLGWTLAGLSVGPIVGGALMLADDSSRNGIPAAVTIGTAALVGIIGVVLGVTHPFTTRPGTIAAWTFR